MPCARSLSLGTEVPRVAETFDAPNRGPRVRAYGYLINRKVAGPRAHSHPNGCDHRGADCWVTPRGLAPLGKRHTAQDGASPNKRAKFSRSPRLTSDTAQ